MLLSILIINLTILIVIIINCSQNVKINDWVDMNNLRLISLSQEIYLIKKQLKDIKQQLKIYKKISNGELK